MGGHHEMESLAKDCLIPKLPFLSEEKEVSELKDFFTSSNQPHCTSSRTQNLTKILALLKEGTFTGSQKPTGWAALILFLAEQHDGSQPWSSPQNATLVSELLIEIRLRCCGKYGDEKYGNLLQGLFTEDFENALTSRNTIFYHVLKAVRTKLRPEEWKYYPATAYSFHWILLQIKYPQLSDFVDDVLPPSLLLTDDYANSYKLMGLDCIIHCIDNVNKAELLRNNWAMVIYDALHKLIQDKDSRVVDKVAPTLLKILSFIEESPNECSNKLTKYDDTMKKILFTIEFSSDLNQKKTWIPHLISFITKMGHATLHWVDRISSMLLDFTTCNDPELWMAILKCVEVCIQTTWLKPSSDAFAEVLLRIVFNSSAFADKEQRTDITGKILYEKIGYCFELLSACEDFENTKAQIQEILKTRESKQFNPLFLHELDKIVI